MFVRAASFGGGRRRRSSCDTRRIRRANQPDQSSLPGDAIVDCGADPSAAPRVSGQSRQRRSVGAVARRRSDQPTMIAPNDRSTVRDMPVLLHRPCAAQRRGGLSMCELVHNSSTMSLRFSSYHPPKRCNARAGSRAGIWLRHATAVGEDASTLLQLQRRKRTQHALARRPATPSSASDQRAQSSLPQLFSSRTSGRRRSSRRRSRASRGDRSRARCRPTAAGPRRARRAASRRADTPARPRARRVR